ncbi:hypothetical protein ACLB2K_017508 [Fragaria x ananassa]
MLMWLWHNHLCIKNRAILFLQELNKNRATGILENRLTMQVKARATLLKDFTMHRFIKERATLFRVIERIRQEQASIDAQSRAYVHPPSPPSSTASSRT